MKSKNTITLVLIIIVVIIFIVLNLFLLSNSLFDKGTSKETGEVYNPQINPNDFVSTINNKYLTFTPGTKYIYQGKAEEGTERVEVYVTNDIKKVMGVNAIVVWDREWLNGELIEDTKDWFAQDKYGNVWYFGEDSKELVDGKIVSRAGSWEAGVNGAKPGIVMKANPKAGDKYRQEYLKGEAEDMAEVVALGVGVKVGYGSFSNCLQTRDWTPLEPGADEYKYYCPEVGVVVYEVGLEDGESIQLVGIETGSEKPKDNEPEEELKKEMTEEEAKRIALKEVPGRVTDVAIEKKLGKIAYVVEIDADNGPETDVIIDMETGKVLDIET